MFRLGLSLSWIPAWRHRVSPSCSIHAQVRISEIHDSFRKIRVSYEINKDEMWSDARTYRIGVKRGDYRYSVLLLLFSALRTTSSSFFFERGY